MKFTRNFRVIAAAATTVVASAPALVGALDTCAPQCVTDNGEQLPMIVGRGGVHSIADIPYIDTIVPLFTRNRLSQHLPKNHLRSRRNMHCQPDATAIDIHTNHLPVRQSFEYSREMWCGNSHWYHGNIREGQPWTYFPMVEDGVSWCRDIWSDDRCGWSQWMFAKSSSHAVSTIVVLFYSSHLDLDIVDMEANHLVDDVHIHQQRQARTRE